MDSFRIYSGTSMNPLFQNGDRLLTRPVECRDVRRGDVICFTTASGFGVVHRVIGAAGAGLRTRGDNNDAADAMPVDGNGPLLLVCAIDRGGRRIAVRGGGWGMWLCRRIRARRACRRLLACPARALLRMLPAWCFRGRSEALSLHRFRDDEFLYEGERPMARRRNGGSWRILAVPDRFRYRPDELERRFPPANDEAES